MTEGRVQSCAEPVSCPRCGGCGYDDDCCSESRAKRPGCWRCGGLGLVLCEVKHSDPIGEPHGVLVPINGAICDSCDKPTPPGDGGCPDCWQSLDGMALADIKAAFATGDLSIVKEIHDDHA